MATENPESKRKAGGGKLSRSETVTVRLDPKLRYLAELAARKQRRTVSSFIEWAVEESLNRVIIEEDQATGGQNDKSIADVAPELWDVDEPDRFAKLAIHYPDLLTHEEQTLWKLVRENEPLWKCQRSDASGKAWTPFEQSNLSFPRLREYWTLIIAWAQTGAGIASRTGDSCLHERKKSESTQAAGLGDMKDIPQ